MQMVVKIARSSTCGSNVLILDSRPHLVKIARDYIAHEKAYLEKLFANGGQDYDVWSLRNKSLDP